MVATLPGRVDGGMQTASVYMPALNRRLCKWPSSHLGSLPLEIHRDPDFLRTFAQAWHSFRLPYITRGECSRSQLYPSTRIYSISSALPPSCLINLPFPMKTFLEGKKKWPEATVLFTDQNSMFLSVVFFFFSLLI